MLKKLAENVCQPISYNRLASILSTVSGKISMPTVSKYLEQCEDAWMLMRLRNVKAPFADRQTNCKYYFTDNGLLNLFLIDANATLLENVVALELFRHLGYNTSNERCSFITTGKWR